MFYSTILIYRIWRIRWKKSLSSAIVHPIGLLWKQIMTTYMNSSDDNGKRRRCLKWLMSLRLYLGMLSFFHLFILSKRIIYRNKEKKRHFYETMCLLLIDMRALDWIRYQSSISEIVWATFHTVIFYMRK